MSPRPSLLPPSVSGTTRRRWWRALASCCGAVGVVSGWWGPAAGCLVVIAVLTGAIAAWSRALADLDLELAWRHRVVRPIATGVLTLVTMFAALGLLFGSSLGLLVLLVMTATCPGVTDRIVLIVAGPVDAVPADTSELADLELCHVWRTSFLALQHAASAHEASLVVTYRAALLDELAHRDPDAFARWMTSGPRADADPACFYAPRW